MSFCNVFLSQQIQSSRNLQWTHSVYLLSFFLSPLIDEESTSISLETFIFVSITYFWIFVPPFTRTCMWDEDWASLSCLWKLVLNNETLFCSVERHRNISLSEVDEKSWNYNIKESCFCEPLFLYRLPFTLAWDTVTIFRNKEAEYHSACLSSFSGKSLLIFLF